LCSTQGTSPETVAGIGLQRDAYYLSRRYNQAANALNHLTSLAEKHRPSSTMQAKTKKHQNFLFLLKRSP
jgi:hypothetical protein